MTRVVLDVDGPAVPVVPGESWLTLSQAAADLGMTRQNAHLMARDGKFKTLHTVARGTIRLVAEREVADMKQVRVLAAEEGERA